MTRDWKTLREKHPNFTFKSYKYRVQNNQLLIHFNYEISSLEIFSHELVVRNVDQRLFDNSDKQVLDNLIFHVGLVLSLSYWKLTCSSNFNVEANELTLEGSRWFDRVLYDGMGQYFFENKINFMQDKFLDIKFAEIKDKTSIAHVRSDKVLIPFSGGKDSTVTLNLLKDKFECGLFLLYPQTFAAYDIAEMTNLPIHEVENKIDHKLLDLNDKGYLNGHTPYSALLMTLSILVAYLFQYSDVAFSNEAGSDEDNLTYLNQGINHQFSKSWRYEKLFDKYNKNHLSDINVFSFLRPFLDIQITKIFSKYPKYFKLVRSCNVGQKEGIWCGSCPKCLSTYILLSPFVGFNKVNEIFEKNLFEDESLTKLLEDLISETETKPFECVGTKAELRAALYLSVKNKIGKLPVLLDHFNSKFSNGIDDNSVNILLRSWNSSNNLPKPFESHLKKSYEY